MGNNNKASPPLENPVSNTAYYCCGVRMDDARQPSPLGNDIYAARFMDQRGLTIS